MVENVIAHLDVQLADHLHHDHAMVAFASHAELGSTTPPDPVSKSTRNSCAGVPTATVAKYLRASDASSNADEDPRPGLHCSRIQSRV